MAVPGRSGDRHRTAHRTAVRAGDLIFESPRSAVITFFGTLAGVALFLVVEFGWELLKERWKQKR